MKKKITFIDKDKRKIVVEITIREGKLTIRGHLYLLRPSEGYPLHWNSSGQIYPDIVPANKYQKAFVAYWERWNLNDMRAGCEHQRALRWGRNEIVVTTYRMTTEAQREQSRMEKLVKETLKSTGIIHLTPEQLRIYRLEFEVKDTEYAKMEDKEKYRSRVLQTMPAGHVREKEHPEGVLLKPCPVCGYKYGASRLMEELPPKVEVAIEFFARMLMPDEKKEE